jgi:YegS/Rv2252/BmrU family lipid kinase
MHSLFPLVAILNPRSDRGRTGARAAALQSRLAAEGEVELRPTEGPGDAVRLAIEAASAGARTVLAIGGDGTVHETANGLLQMPPDQRPRMGVFPSGSGNDFAHMLGVTTDLEACLAMLRSPHIRSVDAVRLTLPDGQLRYCVNNIGMLLDGEINRASHQISWPRGSGLYYRAALETLLRRPQTVRLALDWDGRREELDAIVLSLGNGARSGGKFRLTPHAALDDGKMDYVLVEPMSRLRLLWLLHGAMQGDAAPRRGVRRGQFRSLTLRASQPLTAHVDGELFLRSEQGIHDCQIDVLPGELAVVAPRGPA